MEIAKTQYKLSFASRALLLPESIKLAELFIATGDWAEVRKRVKESNLLQTRTASSSQKLCCEAIKRLQTLTEKQHHILVNGTREEQQYVLWLAICKQYKFVFDFAVEILHEKYLRADTKLELEDFDRFFNVKADWHDELAKLNLDMQRSVRRTIMRMLREAGILTKGNIIVPPLFTRRFVEVLSADSKVYLAIFPVSESDVKALVR